MGEIMASHVRNMVPTQIRTLGDPSRETPGGRSQVTATAGMVSKPIGIWWDRPWEAQVVGFLFRSVALRFDSIVWGGFTVKFKAEAYMVVEINWVWRSVFKFGNFSETRWQSLFCQCLPFHYKVPQQLYKLLEKNTSNLCNSCVYIYI